MTFRSENELQRARLSDVTFCRPLSEQEQVRKEVASLLEGHVQSGLSVCDVWLSMAEQLLADVDAEGTTAEGNPAERIMRALSLLYKVRGKVEQLRKTDVRRAARALYPTSISRGLRPAFVALTEALAEEEGGGRGEGKGGFAQPERASSAEIASFCDGIAVDDAPAVEWMFGDRFRCWDGCSNDETVLYVRLEAYRLVEAVLRALRTVDKSLSSVPTAAGAGRGVRPRPKVHIRLDVEDECLRVHVHLRSGRGDAEDGTMFQLITKALPRDRFERAGGTLLVCSSAGDGLHVSASLPVTEQAIA